MSKHREEMVNLEVFVKFATEASALCVYEGDEQWIPRSTMSAVTDREIDDAHAEEMTIRVARWKVEQFGWV